MNKKVLIIKTSSLGDIIHTLPALTDCGEGLAGTRFDWLIEDAYKEIPSWHPLVDKVIPVKIRQWRKQPLRTLFSDPWKDFRRDLALEQYDAVIDAQGLVKSAFLSPMAKGHRYGFDKDSAREPLSSYFYQCKINVQKNLHAVERIRQLFASSLGYLLPQTLGDYGIKSNFVQPVTQPYLVFLHGTLWQSKQYPEVYWHQLIALAANDGLKVKLLWGDKAEFQRAKRLAENHQHVEVMNKLTLGGIAELLIPAKAAIAVDTGLGHLAAAVDCPSLSLFSASNPELTAAYGINQRHLSATLSCNPCLQRQCALRSGKLSITDEGYDNNIQPPCFSTLPPDMVWSKLQSLLR